MASWEWFVYSNVLYDFVPSWSVMVRASMKHLMHQQCHNGRVAVNDIYSKAMSTHCADNHAWRTREDFQPWQLSSPHVFILSQKTLQSQHASAVWACSTAILGCGVCLSYGSLTGGLALVSSTILNDNNPVGFEKPVSYTICSWLSPDSAGPRLFSGNCIGCLAVFTYCTSASTSQM